MTMTENWTTEVPPPQPAVERWEYTAHEIKAGTLDREMQVLNRAGAEG